MEWIEVFDDISRWIDSDRMSNCSLKGHQQKVINIHCWIKVLVLSEASLNPLESVPKPSVLFCSIWCWCYMLSFMRDWYSLNISSDWDINISPNCSFSVFLRVWQLRQKYIAAEKRSFEMDDDFQAVNHKKLCWNTNHRKKLEKWYLMESL